MVFRRADTRSEGQNMQICHSLRCKQIDMSTRLEHLLRYLRALPTIRVHPELDGRTLDIVHSLKGVTMSANTGCEDSKTELLFVLANERSECVC